MRKSVTVKVLSPDGTLLGCPDAVSVSAFEKRLDGGLGECVIEIAGASEPYSKMAVPGNCVEVWVKDAEVTGEPAALAYSGYVSQVRRRFGRKESIALTCLGHVARMSLDVYRSGTTTTVTHSAVALGAIFADIMAKHATYAKWTRLTCAPGRDVDVAAGPTVTYSFVQRTYREALDSCSEMASGGERWFAHADGRVTFRAPATTPDHVLTFGRHFEDIEVTEDMEQVRSQVLFWNGVTGVGEVYKRYTEAITFERHGPLLERVKDTGATTSDAADGSAARLLALSSGTPCTIRLTVIDSAASETDDGIGYDIESIDPGDTVRLAGFDEELYDFLGGAMTVLSVTYAFDRAVLTLEARPVGLYDWQRRTRAAVVQEATEGSPASFTE